MAEIDLRFGDCLTEMAKMPSESIDLVVTDPAYESMMRWQGVGTTARMGMGRKGSGSDDLENKWFDVFPNSDFPDLVQEIHRLLKPERIAYIMCDWETLKLLHTYAIEEGVFSPVGYGGIFEPCKPLVVEWEGEDNEYKALVKHVEKWLIKYANDFQGGVDTGFQEDAINLLAHIGKAIVLMKPPMFR